MDFEKMSLGELKSLAKEREIKGYSALKKSELIALLSGQDSNNNVPAASVKAMEAEAQSSKEDVKKTGTKKAESKKAETKKTEDTPDKKNVKPDDALNTEAAKPQRKSSTKTADSDAAPLREKKTQVTEKNSAEGDKKTPISEKQNSEEAAKVSVSEKKATTPEKQTPQEELRAAATRIETRQEPKANVDGVVPAKYESTTARGFSNSGQGSDEERPQYRPQQNRSQQSRQREGYQGDARTPQGPQNRNYDTRANGENQSRNYDTRTNGENQSRNYDTRTNGDNQGRSNDSRTSQQYQSRTNDSRPGQPYQSRTQSNSVQNRDASAAVSGRIVSTARITSEEREALDPSISPEIEQLDSGDTKTGILEIVEGYGFIRCDNFLPGENDVYVSPAQIRKFNLKTGDIIVGNTKVKSPTEKFSALLYIKSINGLHPSEATRRPKFEDLTPIFPNCRLHLETPGCTPAMRIVDLLSPIGKGQRGMIVSQPKAGKTTLLKQIATALTANYPDLHLIILLIDERPEEVTDMKESIRGDNVEVIYSTFDELPENHKRVSEMVIERAKRLVEHKKDVVILLDSITRLARAYNLTVTASGRTLSGGLDPAALHMPKKFFGAARCMREGGSLTILATALVDTGSRMDDVVFEEFKGTGNMELVLDRNLSERRIFPAIDLPKSSTRREDLLLTPEEVEANNILRKAFNSNKAEDAVERIISLFSHTRSNREFIEVVKKTKLY